MTVAALFACTPEPADEPVYEKPLKVPNAVAVEQGYFNYIVTITWADSNDSELGYSVWMQETGAEAQLLAELAPDTCQYTVDKDLVPGQTYSFGVRAVAGEEYLSSPVVYKTITLVDYTDLPYPVILEDDVTVTPAVIGVKYKISKSSQVKDVKAWGLCWAADHTPTIEDAHAHGPKKVGTMEQLISNAWMTYDSDYRIRAYAVIDFMDEEVAIYSNEIKSHLGPENKGITFNWTEITPAGFPSEIKVYKTTDKLNGRNFNGWYAIADVSTGKVECRVNHPTDNTLKTLENIYTEDNYVLTNAGFFNMNTGATNDFYAVEGKMVAGAADVLKGTFGVDVNQVPSVHWMLPYQEKVPYFYDYPMPINANGVYEYAYPDYPTTCVSWNPYYAIKAGPLLVMNGNCVFDNTQVDGKYLTNFEQIASDIFSFGSNPPDRTAVGYTKDGKIVLFICDGRITESEGATILETAQIMKGLGCEGALNLDGGGSTAMTLNGTRVNSLKSNKSGGTENRKVASSIGFYKVK